MTPDSRLFWWWAVPAYVGGAVTGWFAGKLVLAEIDYRLHHRQYAF